MAMLLLDRFRCKHRGIKSQEIKNYTKYNIVENHEPGKCYYSISNKNIEEWEMRNAFVIEVTKPVYSKQVKSIKTSELSSEYRNDKTITIQTTKPHIVYEFRNNMLENLNYDRDIGYVYCVIEKPTQYLTITLDSTISNEIEVEMTIIEKASKITYTKVNKPPNNLSENQIYLPRGYFRASKSIK